jgi:O-antigen ligase
MVNTDVDEGTPTSVAALRARQLCFWCFIFTLAWAPFPLGSNREWSWSILVLLICGCWFLWTVWILTKPEFFLSAVKKVWLPGTLAAITLLWAIVQALPIVPASWAHPLWPITADLLHRPVAAAVSLNPWRTLSEVVKLFTYLLATFLAFTLARNVSRAKKLLYAIIAIGAFYAIYAFVLGLIGQSQYALFYSLPAQASFLSGPFVLHNSFATFEGLAALASVACLAELAYNNILASKGLRRLMLTSLQFTFGKGLPIVVSTILTISALVAAASRAGFFSTVVALLCMGIFLTLSLRGRASRRWLIIGALALIVLLVVLVWISGDTLNGRIVDLKNAGDTLTIRLVLWDAALRMIVNAPWLGLGLGTFQDAYPMYATKLLPFIMDKTHCDYLEFAAGLGLPGALCWWSAIAISMARMIEGVFKRRRNRLYPFVGLGGTLLVAVHSTVDFSLQIPAVALTYAALLGVGLAQSYSSKVT